MFRLSVCAEIFFKDLPFQRRVQEINARGFLAEFWRWMHHPIEALEADPSVQISTFGGSYVGSLVHPDALEPFLAGVKKSVEVARRLRCRELILLTGEQGPQGEIVHPVAAHPVTRWVTAYKGLCEVAHLAERFDVVFNLEPLNTKVDHAGYPMPLAEDAARLIEQVGSPRIRMLLDVYHTQIQEGNVIQVIRDYQKFIGYVHVADVPGRHEPGTGEINYPKVAEALRQCGYEGIIGLEAFPLQDDETAMRRFRDVFA